MYETEKPNTLHNLLENYDEQRKINCSNDWKKLSRRISRDKLKRKIFTIGRNAAAIFLPMFLLWQYAIQPVLNKQQDESLITVTSSPYGVSKITLSDGSQVWLNASSTLTYPKEFNTNSRSVTLNGEAFFSVTADKAKRFNVQAGNEMTVSAYGTEFNVNSFAGNNTYSVILSEGNVELLFPATRIKQNLMPNQLAEFSVDTKDLRIKEADIYLQTAWKDGKMVFYRETFKQIAEKLSNRFNVTIVFADKKLEEQQYTGTFTTESVTEILDLLKQTAPINYSVVYGETTSNLDERKRIITISNR